MPTSNRPPLRFEPRHRSDDRSAAAGGAYTTLAGLIGLRFAARELSLAPPPKVRQPLAGLVASKIRGRGMDFAEVRRYEPGDDVRAMDWRVTARTGKPHTKIFQEDKERPVFLVVDQTTPMFFGSERAFKSVAAAEAAALIAWTALECGDRVGGIVFGDGGHHEVRPRRGKRAVLRLLGAIQDANARLPGATADTPAEDRPFSRVPLVDALEAARRTARHGALAIVVSDFAALDELAIKHLQQLGRGTELAGIRVSDRYEQQLPPPDTYTITDGATRTRIDTRSARARDRFGAASAHRRAAQTDAFVRARGTLLELATGEDPVAALGERLRPLLGARP